MRRTRHTIENIRKCGISVNETTRLPITISKSKPL